MMRLNVFLLVGLLGAWIALVSTEECEDYKGQCSQCVRAKNGTCGYWYEDSTCLPGDASGPFEDQATTLSSWQFGYCCSDVPLHSCNECIALTGCGYEIYSDMCIPSDSARARYFATTLACQCINHGTNCSACRADNCSFCVDTEWGQCVPPNGVGTDPDTGVCLIAANTTCDCRPYTSCEECQVHPECRWHEEGALGSFCRPKPSAAAKQAQCGKVYTCKDYSTCDTCVLPECHYCYDYAEREPGYCVSRSTPCTGSLSTTTNCSECTHRNQDCETCTANPNCAFFPATQQCVRTYRELPDSKSVVLRPGQCAGMTPCQRNVSCHACYAQPYCQYDLTMGCVKEWVRNVTPRRCEDICALSGCSNCANNEHCHYCTPLHNDDTYGCIPLGVACDASRPIDVLEPQYCGPCDDMPNCLACASTGYINSGAHEVGTCLWCQVPFTCVFAARDPVTGVPLPYPHTSCGNNVTLSTQAGCRRPCPATNGSCSICAAADTCIFNLETGECRTRAAYETGPQCSDSLVLSLNSHTGVRYLRNGESLHFSLRLMEDHPMVILDSRSAEKLLVFVSDKGTPGPDHFAFSNAAYWPDSTVRIPRNAVLQSATLNILATCSSPLCTMNLTVSVRDEKPLTPSSSRTASVLSYLTLMMILTVVGLFVWCIARVMRRRMNMRENDYAVLNEVDDTGSARRQAVMRTYLAAEGEAARAFPLTFRNGRYLAIPIVGPQEAEEMRRGVNSDGGPVNFASMDCMYIGIMQESVREAAQESTPQEMDDS